MAIVGGVFLPKRVGPGVQGADSITDFENPKLGLTSVCDFFSLEIVFSAVCNVCAVLYSTTIVVLL